jgi:hypothetical protein
MEHGRKIWLAGSDVAEFTAARTSYGGDVETAAEKERAGSAIRP